MLGKISSIVSSLNASLLITSETSQNRHKEVRCYLCKQIGHYSNQCIKNKLCFKCKGFGHYESHCPDNVGVSRKFNSTCYKCKQLGHFSDNCKVI